MALVQRPQQLVKTLEPQMPISNHSKSMNFSWNYPGARVCTVRLLECTWQFRQTAHDHGNRRLTNQRQQRNGKVVLFAGNPSNGRPKFKRDPLKTRTKRRKAREIKTYPDKRKSNRWVNGERMRNPWRRHAARQRISYSSPFNSETEPELRGGDIMEQVGWAHGNIYYTIIESGWSLLPVEDSQLSTAPVPLKRQPRPQKRLKR